MSEQQPDAASKAEDETVEIGDHPENERYEVHVAGTLAGYSEYQRGAGQIAFTHTVVVEAFSGRGLAGQLAEKALEDARANGVSVLPFCPFFKDYMTKHPQYTPLVPEDRRAEFGL
jgi:predicted GNAT family acetyltransferase